MDSWTVKPLWHQQVMINDTLTPRSAYNKSEGNERNRLPSPVYVEDVKHGQKSQTGTMFQVRTIGGGMVWLDADWFERPNVRMSGG